MPSEMVRLLRSFDDDVSQRRRRGLWRMLIVFSVVKILGFIAVGALAWLSLAPLMPGAFTSDSSNWNVLSDALQAIQMLQIADFAAALLAIGPVNRDALPAYRRALMSAVAARDARLARAITVLPSAGTDVRVPSEDGAVTIGLLAHPMRTLGVSTGLYLIGALAGLAVFGLGVGLSIVSLLTPPPITHAPTLANWFEWLAFPCVLMLLGVADAVVALATRRYARMEGQDMSASIDAEGVTFTRGGARSQSRRLRWRDARGFALISFTDVMGRLHEAFALSTADEDFLWAAEYASLHAPPDLPPESASWRLSAHQLVDQVIQHTGLPLLDLSQTVADVAATDVPMSQSAASSLLTRAHIIARERGDQTFARELAQRLDRGSMVSERAVRMAGRRGVGVSRFSDAQRDETLRLARELLPYYPPSGQTPHGSRTGLLKSAYWRSEIILQFLISLMLIGASVWFFVSW